MTTLNLNKCDENVVNNLPDGMQMRGNLLYLYNWPTWKDDSRDDVYRLPKNLKVSDDLTINSTGLRYIPEGVSVGGNFSIKYAYDLKNVHNLFKVGESLIMSSSKVEFLPDNLKVGYHCDLHGCNHLRSLPSNMKIGGCLDITLCRKLKKIPEDLYIGGWVVYYYGSKVKKEEVPLHLKAKLRWDKTMPTLRIR